MTEVNMSGQVCLVTGANSGIGKETALALAEMGATVVMLCRDRGRGTAAQQEIIAASGNEQVDLLLADLAVQQEVREVADAFRARYSRLDVLVNNAGAVFQGRRESTDGLEMTFALNHLGPFLLTNLLLDLIMASAPARIVNVSSAAHRGSRINFDDLRKTKGYNGFGTYGESKLANILFTIELTRRLEGTGVTANAMHPGLVATNFASNNGVLAKVGMKLISPFIRSSSEGAATVIYLASSPEVADMSGHYFVDEKPAETSGAAREAETAQRLWEVSAELTGLKIDETLSQAG